ncbi:MAG: hypothetical protein LQ350_006407 [Teloschistes chrysophthalmus]|nr:MAG: hypothetical protein LQ350_006407 [Niorma chrysophthalma]
MQHLPLPRDVVPPGPSLVPYVCGEEYDGGPFLKYFHRQGREDLFDVFSRALLIDESKISLPPVNGFDGFNALIQTWLFFGLLNEILGTLFKPSQYVRTLTSLDKPTQIVDTSELVPVLHAWVKTVQQSEHTEIQKQTHFEHIAACRQLTRDVLDDLRVNSKFISQLTSNRLLRLSIASVAEVLVYAVKKAYGNQRSSKLPYGWSRFYRDTETSLQLKRLGLCPSEIQRIGNNFWSIQAYHCLRWMRKAKPTTCHDHCTKYECRPPKNNTTQYVTKHVDDICRCSDYPVKVSEVVDILSNGSLPLLKITPGTSLNEMKIVVIQASPGSDYVAYSHVWSDDLGNPYANSLPRCQLKRLHNLTRQFVPGAESDENTRGLSIWIDTLCCPVEPPAAKNLALRSMKVPYTEASHVLVLDSSLEHVGSSELHLIEIGLRIFTTGWMRRLWTLQEGALPRKLWFQFKDKAVDLDWVWNEAVECSRSDLGRVSLSTNIILHHHQLRGFFHQFLPEITTDFVSVSNALKFRSDSVSTDEPLLVGGLLKLDLGYILDGDESSRMQRLLKILPSIPRSIVFTLGLRMSQRGFRWAPISLMESTPKVRELSSPPGYTGTLTEDGLRIKLPAFPIRMPTTPFRFRFLNEAQDYITYLGIDSYVPNTFLYARNQDGTWLDLLVQDKNFVIWPTLWEMLQESTDGYTLLLEPASLSTGFDNSTRALLVHCVSSGSEIGQVIYDTRLEVIARTEDWVTLLEAGYQAARKLIASDLTAEILALTTDDEDTQETNSSYDQ